MIKTRGLKTHEMSRNKSDGIANANEDGKQRQSQVDHHHFTYELMIL